MPPTAELRNLSKPLKKYFQASSQRITVEVKMAASTQDALSSLRQSITFNNAPIPTTSAESQAPENAADNLAIATHLHFPGSNAHTLPLDTPTRFISSDAAVDLRSIIFAWQNKDVSIPDYIASAQQLNDELAASADQKEKTVQILPFVERLDLITWLEGASDESEYIKPLEGDSAAAKSAQLAAGLVGGVSTVPSGVPGARPGKQVDPRLQEIYNLERRMGDRNTILRGVKPTVSSLDTASSSARENTTLCADSTANLNTYLGFLLRSQTLRAIHERPQEIQRSVHERNGRRPSHDNDPRDPGWQEIQPTARSHHPPLPLRLILAPHVEHQILPRIRHLHPARQQPGQLLRRDHPARVPPSAEHRPEPRLPLHPGRQHRPVQTRLLEPRRRRLHHRPDLAVQVVQVA